MNSKNNSTPAASINKDNQYFPVNYALKMWLTMTMQFYATSVKHIKCNHLNYMDYKYLQGCNHSWAENGPISNSEISLRIQKQA